MGVDPITFEVFRNQFDRFKVPPFGLFGGGPGGRGWLGVDSDGRTVALASKTATRARATGR